MKSCTAWRSSLSWSHFMFVSFGIGKSQDKQRLATVWRSSSLSSDVFVSCTQETKYIVSKVLQLGVCCDGTILDQVIDFNCWRSANLERLHFNAQTQTQAATIKYASNYKSDCFAYVQIQTVFSRDGGCFHRATTQDMFDRRAQTREPRTTQRETVAQHSSCHQEEFTLHHHRRVRWHQVVHLTFKNLCNWTMP